MTKQRCVTHPEKDMKLLAQDDPWLFELDCALVLLSVEYASLFSFASLAAAARLCTATGCGLAYATSVGHI